tara:strand:+ start:378 stop:1076 length:699 start_codon:yes stop_codon:yes gene_type:complete
MESKISTIFKKTLSKFRKLIFKNYREQVLSKIISVEIEKLQKIRKKKIIKILDFGSGYNPGLIIKIINRLTYKYKRTKFLAYCYDFYSNKELKIMNNNSNIKFLNIKSLKDNNVVQFDFCLVVDVLHHIGLVNSRKIIYVTKKLKKISKFIIIKDHFQYGFFSNLMLLLMDFIGNYGDGVKIPRIYFSIKSFEKFLSKLNLEEIKRINDKNYYKWYWFYFNSKKLQFISILK